MENNTSDEQHQDSQVEESPDENEAGAHQEERSGLLEKLFTILSVGLLLFLVIFLGVQSFREDEPAAFDVQISSTEKRGDFTAVAVILKNTGDQTAKAVQIRGEAPVAGGKPVEAEATMDWLPAKSQRHVTLLFPPNADFAKLGVKVVGYEDP